MYKQMHKAMPIKLTKKTKLKSSSLKGRNKTETTERKALQVSRTRIPKSQKKYFS